MRAIGGHRALGRHARVPDAVGAGHGGQAEAPRHVGGKTDLLVKLHPLPRANELHIRAFAREPRAGPREIGHGQRKEQVSIARRGTGFHAKCGREFRGQITEARGRAQRDFPDAGRALAIDRKPRAVRTTIGHHFEHGAQIFAEAWP